MGAVINRGYNVEWNPVDGDGPDANGNISNPKAWLKKVLYDQWDLTRQNFARLNANQKARFCEATGIDEEAMSHDDRMAVTSALECFMSEDDERDAKETLETLYRELVQAN